MVDMAEIWRGFAEDLTTAPIAFAGHLPRCPLVTCEHASNIDQLFGEHATTNQMVATPIGVQSGRRFTSMAELSGASDPQHVIDADCSYYS